MQQRKKKYKSLKMKLLWLVLVAALIPALILLGGLIFSINKVTSDSQVIFNERIQTEVQNHLKDSVDITIASMKFLYGQTASVPGEQVSEALKQYISTLRSEDSGYFFVFRNDGVELIAPENTSHEGQDLLDLTDSTGKKPIREILQMAEHGGGFVTYTWLNPLTGKEEEKTTYVAPVKLGNLDLVIGSGVYLSTLKQTAIAMQGDINEIQKEIIIGSLAGGVLILVMVLLLDPIYITKSISNPVHNLVKAIKRMAKGDFTEEITVHSNDEIGEMGFEIEAMKTGLSNLLNQLSESAGRVGDTFQEIASGNHNLSKRTQEQAATLEEIAATVEEVNSSVIQASTNSSQAQQLSQSTLEVVNAGERSVQETLVAMNQISASSKQIFEIVKVVNDIAFQTNLLALNAAVEAARAGEQGRGFAVVAAEVRNLARRVAESSKEIEQLIKESVERVDLGNLQVQQSAEMLRKIVLNTKQTSDVIAEVASTMREQTSAAAQIQISIEQLNQVTQQNASMVEEIAASSLSLNSETKVLNDMVCQFRITKKEATTKGVTSKPSKPSDVSISAESWSDSSKKESEFIGDGWEKF